MDKIIKEIKLARGILFHNDCVLLARDVRTDQGHYFLPGGHIEQGESIKGALPREWKEELGWSVEVSSFYGCLEHSWSFKRKQDDSVVEVFEINFLFGVSTSATNLAQEPVSKESHLQFSWIPINELSTLALLPAPLKNLIPDIASRNHNAVWASTLD